MNMAVIWSSIELLIVLLFLSTLVFAYATLYAIVGHIHLYMTYYSTRAGAVQLPGYRPQLDRVNLDVGAGAEPAASTSVGFVHADPCHCCAISHHLRGATGRT